ncbi:MAG: 3-phosphoshikimate 1-carboxyvinyltransferase [Rhabdochlamydiaceae bacterium]|nr:3-phosphoshikimate 1-carboxyvinyltransferase [Candidatus Amphrikana amoebophyrae]
MQKISITPSLIKGSIKAPPSKSQTLRALYFALLANGESQIVNPLIGNDTTSMLNAIEKLGATYKKRPGVILVAGIGSRPSSVTGVIDAGNSGIVYRFMTALCSHIAKEVTITGDESIRTRRVITPLLDALNRLGPKAQPSNSKGFGPIRVQGPWKKNHTQIDGRDSQPVSALIYAAAFAPIPMHLTIHNMMEKPWIDLSLSWLTRFNIPFMKKGYSSISLEGNFKLAPFTYQVAGDFSSVSTFIALATIQNSPLTIYNLQFDEPQGDKILIDLITQMGGNFHIEQFNQTLTVLPHNGLRGIEIDLDQCIDLVPILSLIGCFCQGQTRLYNGAIAKTKECDRLKMITQELGKMGAKISCDDDSVIISKSYLHGNHLLSHSDHRMAMTLTASGLLASGNSTLSGVECVAKTFPHFFEEISRLGGIFEYCDDRI